jgi:hypothetical protein
MWQEIDGLRLVCHLWQDLYERMIDAMTVLITLLLLAAVFAPLARFARHDRFAGPRTQHLELDDLGAVGDHHLVRL